MKKFYILALSALVLGAFSASAIRAKKGFRDFHQEDGSVIKAELVGDEHFHYYLSEDGIPMTLVDGTMRYVSADASGKVAISPMKATDIAFRSADARTFVSSIDKEKAVEALRQQKMQSSRRASTLAQSGMGLYTSNFPRTGDIRGLVILVEYTDVKFTHPNPSQYFTDMLNKEGFSEYNGTGCAKEYFLEQSMNQFRPQFDVFGPVTLPNPRKYYGGNDFYGDDQRPEEMVVDAAKILDSQIDFSQYDLDHDGKVDNVFIFYAGQGEASYGPAESVWPHSWELSSAGKSLVLDGVRLDRYACSNEWERNRPDGVGTFIHEFSHVMGLPDLYHTTNAYATFTPDSYSVLDYGPYNNDGCTPPNYSIYERNAMGWIDPILLEGPADITLENIADSNQGCIALTEKSNEFFLFENRQQKGWDKYIPYHGLLIWHIDFVQSVFDNNVVNNTSSHQYVDIVEAGGTANSQNAATLKTYPWPGTLNKTSFTSSTAPAFKSWAGKAINLPITKITESNGTITFQVAGGKIEFEPITGLQGTGYDNGSASLKWDPVEKATAYKLSLYTKNDAGLPESYVVKDFVVEGTSYAATNLRSDTRYYFTVRATAGSTESAPSEEAWFDMPSLAWVYTRPQTLPVTEISSTGFTALWEEIPAASSYILNVSQEVLGDEETVIADFGNGDELVIPSDWFWSGTVFEMYGSTSIGYFGESAPALKFATDGRFLETALFEGPITEVSFWEKTVSGSTTVPNTLTLEGRASLTEDWTLIDSHTPSMDTNGATVTIKNIPAETRQLRLVFYKSRGNLSIDDISIKYQAKEMVALEGYTDKNVGNVTSYVVVAPMSDKNRYSYNVTAVNQSGELSAVSDTRSVPDNETSGIGSIETSSAQISVDGLSVSITGVSDSCLIRVYSLAGTLILTSSSDHSGNVSFEFPSAGLYLVKAGDNAYKIIAR